MLFIVSQLFFAPTSSFLHRLPHAIRNPIGIDDHLTVHITCCTTCCLCQRAMRAQESLLIGIQNSDQRDFWQIQPFT